MNKDVFFEFKIDNDFKFEAIVDLKSTKIKKLQEKALNDLVRNLKIKGFRVGKVPLNLALNQISEDQKVNAFLKAKINFAFSIVRKNLQELRIISKPEYKILVDITNSFKIKFNFQTQEALFVSKMPAYTKLNFQKQKVEVSQKEIKNEISLLQKEYAMYESVDKKISVNDYVNIDYQGFIDSKPFLNNQAKKFRLLIGSNSFIKGFESGLLNHKKNDLVTLNLIFPADYKLKNLQNKEVVFKIKINDVEKIILPKIDQEFFKDLNFSNVNSLSSLQEYLQKELLKKKTIQYKNNYIDLIFDYLRTNAKILIPKNLIIANLKNKQSQFNAELAKKNIKLDDYLRLTNMSKKDIDLELEKEIVVELKNEALISKIKNLEKITILNSDLNKQLKMFKKFTNLKKQKINFNFLKTKLSHDMLKNKVYEFLYNNN